MSNYKEKFIQFQPYYKGALHTINNTSKVNNLFLNQSRNKIQIRLNSANNSIKKNKKFSQDKKYSKAKSYLYLSIQDRPTSVKASNHNFLYQSKTKKNYYQSTDMNYPNITLNSNNISQNNIPFQRRRKIIYEADNELAEEYDKLRKIWKEAGVTDVYMDNFEAVTNSKNNTKREILQYIKNEENQMIKFKEEMLKLVSEILKREKDLKNIN